MKENADLFTLMHKSFGWCEGGWEERFGLYQQPGLRDAGTIGPGLLAFHR